MNIVTLLTGIRFGILLRLLARNKVTFRPKYLLRLFILFQNSILSSVFAKFEQKKFGQLIKETTLKKPPVFIIGHWRTGSTYLHQLMNLDTQFTTPTYLQNAIPDHFLFSTKYYTPVMKLFMPKMRPMDNMPVSPGEPQEDEFALIRMGSESPLERLVFPPQEKFFLEGYNEYIPSGAKLERWKDNLNTFYKKITLQTGKQILSKNPLHTLRITLLAEMFPGAKFVYIRRNPLDVVPSTIRMWNIVAEYNCLRNTWKKPDMKEVATELDRFERYAAANKKLCSEQSFTEVIYENLEKFPLQEIKRIYSELNLGFTDDFEKGIIRFLESNRNYIKNTYRITDEERQIILSCME